MKAYLIIPIILILLVGCAMHRDTSNPEKALLGHWRSIEPAGEWFFSAEGVLRLKDAEGNVDELPYKVKPEDTIKIVVPLSKGGGPEVDTDFIEGQFSQDYTEFVGQNTEGTKAFPLIYIDSKEKL